ncbi:hypothetical protein SASPL_112318 [Salvia splendens]|uniref:DUF4218 domain-containing protein n=1 Tax=Salvia splendens TaxID=180675 RepID=A0A8X9A5Z1_SALSN|nr:hypothetical protein SASPL_112318 [Salvia splendens]
MTIFASRDEAYEHLTVDGFIPGYTDWIAHGELPSILASRRENQHNNVEALGDDDMQGLVHDVFGVPNEDGYTDDTNSHMDSEIANGQAREFYRLIDDSNQPLYEGCAKFSKLSFIIRLLHLKCLGRLNNKVFDMLLDLLRDVFPYAMVGLPKSYYEADKLMKKLGLGYEKIDACPNDCTLYWGVNENKTSCDTCHKLRWCTTDKDPTGEKRKVAQKVLCRTKDGYMRHPADSPAWSTFDSLHPDFAEESRNVRLGLASDGINPFKNMSVSHSTWPVILFPYNLPPWMCMKESSFMLSLLIPGPSAPGKNIDIYLQPLIADLKDLWEVGVETYDTSKMQNFQLRASLLWTISDFPGYAYLSGWSTQGEYACPVCNKETHSSRLKHGGKYCYMGHRRFLHKEHEFRKNRRLFDGTVEFGEAPQQLSGDMVMDDLRDFTMKYGKLVKDNPKLFSWKKKSIFFELPYWKDNMVRHNLDVMHTEKNACESICATLLDLDGKSKDNYKSRQDLEQMGIRPELHPITNEWGKVYLPAAAYTMSKKERTIFCQVLKNLKVPDGYASNISRCVQLKPPKLLGLKSHDYHIMMQQLLPIALRKTLSRTVRSPLIQLSKYFRELCCKVICPADIIRLEKDIVVVLCQLEKIFPPSFFDVMVHLSVHLATEVKLCGPVHYRWMYPIERYLGTLKSYVRNRSKPEGSIAEGYLVEECLRFCSLYLADYVESKFNRASRNETVTDNTKIGLDVFTINGRSLGKGTAMRLDDVTLKKAHQYVLFNCEAVRPYIEQYWEVVEQSHPHVARHQLERIHSERFAGWFAQYVEGLTVYEENPTLRALKLLARGPNIIGVKYKKYIVNGFRFHTKDLECTKKTQNSGVRVKATTSSFSSTRDQNPILSELDYYGILTDVVELDYNCGHRVVLFDCEWVSKGKRLKTDADGFTLANFSNVIRHYEPFILASQAEQVFYVEDPTESQWSVVVSAAARAHYGMEPIIDVETYLQSNICVPADSIELDDFGWVREDIDGIEYGNYDALLPHELHGLSSAANFQPTVESCCFVVSAAAAARCANELFDQSVRLPPRTLSFSSIRLLKKHLRRSERAHLIDVLKKKAIKCGDTAEIHSQKCLHIMTSKRRGQCSKSVRLQDEPNVSQQRLKTSEGFTTKTAIGRRVYSRNLHQKTLDMVTPSHHSHESVPPLENERLSVDVEQQEDEGIASSAEIVEKQSRGPTYMKNIWGRPLNLPPIHVEYNEFGQAIGGEDSTLCHFLGSIARSGNYCPIDIKSWHAIPKERKTEMLDIVKLRFHVPIIAEKWILESIGLKWRNWKHYLKTRYWADVPIEHLIDDRDERVLEVQWINLLAYWRTEHAKSAMEDCNDQSLEGSDDAIAPDDIFAQIMGKDRPGHVRMMGRGVRPSDLWNETSKSTSNRLLVEYREKIERLEARLATQERVCGSQADTRPNVIVSKPSSVNATTTHIDQVDPLSDNH